MNFKIFTGLLLAAGFTLPSQLSYKANGTGAVTRKIAARLGDIISPMDYGGVCDGATDDSAAMNSAITAAALTGATKTVAIWVNCVGTYTQPVNGVRVLDFRRGSGSGIIMNSAAVEVRAYATGGAGTVGSPWTGWDTAITWTAGTYYFFAGGVYAYTTAPNWALTGIRLVGETGEPTLQFNGTGNAVLLDGGAGAGSGGVYDVQMENLTISGNVNATNGIYARAMHHSLLRNIRVKNVSAACLRMEWTVVDTVDTFRCSNNEGAFTTQPVNCIYLDKRVSDGLQASANTFLNPICEGMSGTGIKIPAAWQNIFIDGTSEGNGIGIELASGSDRNVFIGIDTEVNTTKDVVVGSDFNSFFGVLVATGGGGTHGLHVTGNNNIFHGGLYTSAQIDAGAKANEIDFAFNGSGVVDNGTDTNLIRLWNNNNTRLEGIPWTSRDTVAAIPWTGLGTPDKQDLLAGSYTFTTTPTVISNTVVTASKPWRILFIGTWGNNTEGGGLQQIAPILEATTAAPTLTIGTVIVTISVNGSNQFSAVTGANTAAFSGRIFPISNNQGAAGSQAMLLKGTITGGRLAASGASGAGSIQADTWFASGRAVLTYSATIATDAATGNAFSITATNGTAFTISSPTNLTTGQRLLYTIRNTSGGAHGAITWGATFKTAAAALTVTTAFSKSIEFIYDGTNLIETFRSAADVAN